jgi:uncharacterized protein (DUF305 family)
MQSFPFNIRFKVQFMISVASSRSALIAAVALTCFLSLPIYAQKSDSNPPPVVVQPGAPGQPTRTLPLHMLGARISQSQSDEIKFMKRWLEIRGEPIAPPMPEMPSMDMPSMDMSSHHIQMPGMLNPKQMDGLRKAKGAEFDQLFLSGMIQHHKGALIMVKDLFDTPGAGQDAELFNFATDVDGGQRAEIKIMQTMLGKNQ